MADPVALSWGVPHSGAGRVSNSTVPPPVNRTVTAQQNPNQSAVSKSIAGSVLPLQRAEELIASLTDVVSARITATESGGVDTIHVLVTGETPAKQVVRNIESALMAQLGLRVDHRKISVAATSQRPTPSQGTPPVHGGPGARGAKLGRPVYFEDVEIRGSRAKGVTCRVTLRMGEEHFAGESEEGSQSDKSRVDVAARATLTALQMAGPTAGMFSLEGAKLINVFERDFVFAVVMARSGREQVLLTGSCELRDSAETAAVLAVLDATNRWMDSMPVSPGKILIEDRRAGGR